MTDQTVFNPGLFGGRRAFITGGGTGIGLAIARELGSLGARVILAARTIERLEHATSELRKEGIDARWHPVNIRKDDEVEALFDSVDADHGPPDILVNNAGGQFAAEVLGISAGGFRAVVDLNGTWHMSSAFARRLVDAGRGGRIVNIVLCLGSGLPGMAHAGAARAGVVNLTRTLACEWRRYGIRVNAVAPGTVATSGLENYDKDQLEAVIERLSVSRTGTAREVALAIAYLASPAGDFVTETTLVIDGGEHLIGATNQAPRSSRPQIRRSEPANSLEAGPSVLWRRIGFDPDTRPLFREPLPADSKSWDLVQESVVVSHAFTSFHQPLAAEHSPEGRPRSTSVTSTPALLPGTPTPPQP